MADGVFARIIVKDTLGSFARIDKATNRATMWTVREAGRVAKRTAMKAAPVYRGKDAVSRKQARTGGLAINPNRPVKGLLRASIHSSKRLGREGDAYVNRIASRGVRTHLYAGKQEARLGFMRQGRAAASAAAPAIAARAWGRAIRRG